MDQLHQTTLGAETAATIGKCTLKLVQQSGVKVPSKANPVSWLAVAGAADGAALTAESPLLKTGLMLAGHYGGYRFGLAAPLMGLRTSLIAVTGVTAGAIVPQLTVRTASDPLHPEAPVAPNTAESRRAGMIGGVTGAGLSTVTLLVSPQLLTPGRACSFVALGAISGWADGVASVTNDRKKQALTTAVGHASGFCQSAMPGAQAAARSGLSRTGMMGVALVPFVAASLDNAKHAAP